MQLTPFDVDYQREERAKTRGRLDELKKAKVIPREKPLAKRVVSIPFGEMITIPAPMDFSVLEPSNLRIHGRLSTPWPPFMKDDKPES